jgi:hypothetical protein
MNFNPSITLVEKRDELETDLINFSDAYIYGYEGRLVKIKGIDFPEIVNEIYKPREKERKVRFLRRLLERHGFENLPELKINEMESVCYLLAGVSLSGGFSSSEMAFLGITNYTLYVRRLKELNLWDKVVELRQKRKEYFLTKNEKGEYPDFTIGQLLEAIEQFGISPIEIFNSENIPDYFPGNLSVTAKINVKNRRLEGCLKEILLALQGFSVVEISKKSKRYAPSIRSFLQNFSHHKMLSEKIVLKIAEAQRKNGSWPTDERLKENCRKTKIEK